MSENEFTVIEEVQEVIVETTEFPITVMEGSPGEVRPQGPPAPLPAFGNLTCSISIGARPSATDIAQAVGEELLIGHTTAGSAAKKLKDDLTRNDFIGLS